MPYPRVKSALPMDDYTLILEFDNNALKKYDVTQLFHKDRFAPLKNQALFKAVKVEQGGYAVSWSSEIDLSEYELWRHGQTMS